MAHESFEDEAVAAILNAHFVCIKVDREERPDLDTIYMNYCQLLTGSGGWPLNLWLTPEQVPIYAGTYFPKEDMYGRTGFISVLSHLHKLWVEDPGDLIKKSHAIIDHVGKHGLKKPESVDQFVTQEGLRDLKDRYDDVYGGFSDAPKFPSPHQLLFLMHEHGLNPDDELMAMVDKTLQSMYAGGIYDHVGGGFARYSVDQRWLVPHFEKMLYDNALLLRVYNRGYALTKNPLYKNIAYDILRFLKREMLSPWGGFYTALDADSEGVEGKFAIFTPEEVAQVLGSEANAYADRFDITSEGNFEGKNIPNLIGKEVSDSLMTAFAPENDKLLAYRSKRVAPGRDHKILTSVNGLMLASLSEMYRFYGDRELLGLALELADYITTKVYQGSQLYGTYTDGQLGGLGVLEDYAFVIEGYLDLYQSTFDETYLTMAQSLTQVLDRDYLDQDNGGYYMTSIKQEALIDRPKECYDGAIPSGNSVMALNLLKLSRIKDDLKYQGSYDQLIKAFGKSIKSGPSYFCYMLISLMYRQKGTKDLTIVFANESDLMDHYKDGKVNDLPYFTRHRSSHGGDQPLVDGKTTYYICEDFACRPPVHDLDD